MATRPDIAYAVGMLARHASNPSDQHISAIIHLAGYLMKTKQWSLTYRWQTEMFENRVNGHRFLQAYTDADWAGEEHSGRSTSGYIFLLSDVVHSRTPCPELSLGYLVEDWMREKRCRSRRENRET